MNTELAWVDSHCHLEMLKEDVGASLKRSYDEGVVACITIGTSHKANLSIKQYCQTFKNVYGTFGFHPHGASGVEQSHLDWLKKELVGNDKIVAIGECGFDLYYEHSKRETQQVIFEAQLDLAVEKNMPLVIHSRDADSQTLDMLDAYKGKNLNGVVHCFNSDLSQAKYYLDLGLYLSFNGICTFPKAEPVREVLSYVPLDRILLETDSPYLSPVPYRGKSNYPGRVAIVGEYIARFLGISSKQLSEQILANTKTLFPKFDYEY